MVEFYTNSLFSIGLFLKQHIEPNPIQVSSTRAATKQPQGKQKAVIALPPVDAVHTPLAQLHQPWKTG